MTFCHWPIIVSNTNDKKISNLFLFDKFRDLWQLGSKVVHKDFMLSHPTKVKSFSTTIPQSYHTYYTLLCCKNISSIRFQISLFTSLFTFQVPHMQNVAWIENELFLLFWIEVAWKHCVCDARLVTPFNVAWTSRISFLKSFLGSE